MKNVLTAALAGIMILLTACEKESVTGSGTIATEERGLNNFTRISSSGAADVTVSKGTAFKVEVKGYGNLLSYYETRVVNGTLQLGYSRGVNVRKDNIQVAVTLPVLTGLYTNGSGKITATGDFTGNASFETSISGSGGIHLADGDAQQFSSSINGSGSVEAFGFTAEKATVRINGSGNTRITATNDLNVKINGSGSVYYKGSPNTSINISGSGSVSKQ